jgi:Tol biopolymer transport system component
LGNNIFAVPFDLDGLQVTGGAVSMVEGVMHSGVNAHLQYAFSDSGVLVYAPETTEAGTKCTLVWVDRNGREEPISAAANYYTGPRISPDGTRVALAVTASENRDIWIWDLFRRTLTRLTFNEGINQYPVWTRDSKRVTFYSARPGEIGVYWKSADGTGEEELLGFVQDRALIPWSWAADGKTLALSEAYNGNDIGILSIEGERKHTTLLSQRYSEVDPQISPDGRRMAYTSNESGKDEIYVRSFPNVNGGRWQVSTNGGRMALWSPSGRELFYRNGDAVMAVAVETEPAFKAGKPESLFRGTYVPPSSEGISWDISPDGKHFLMMKPLEGIAEAGGPRKISIVLNWLEELKQRVPAP